MILHNRTHGPWYEPEEPAWDGAQSRPHAPHAWYGDPTATPWTTQHPERLSLERNERSAFHKSEAERASNADHAPNARTNGRAWMRLLPLREPSIDVLSAHAFEQCLERERSLADRGTRHFSVMVLRLRGVERAEEASWRELAHELQLGLRSTDLVGEMAADRLAVLLTDTSLDGAHVVAEWIDTLVLDLDVDVERTIYVYPTCTAEPTSICGSYKERIPPSDGSRSSDRNGATSLDRHALNGHSQNGHVRMPHDRNGSSSNGHGETDSTRKPRAQSTGRRSAGRATNGHVDHRHGTNEPGANGSATNGRATNGHAADSHAPNGHVANGRATNGNGRNGHAANGRAANDRATEDDSPSRRPTRGPAANGPATHGRETNAPGSSAHNVARNGKASADHTQEAPSRNGQSQNAPTTPPHAACWQVKDLWNEFTVPMPWWKRALDVAASSFALLMLSPLLLAVALAIKLDSPGPIIFRQTRVGRGARGFPFYKFRTMFIDAEARRAELEALNEKDGPIFKIHDDPRITRVGRLLRRWSIDELPQLWNILRGDISLVGPRSPLFSEVAEYERWQRRRLNITGGITCIWQVSGRSQVSFREWMRMDMQYVRSSSLWLDLWLLARTIPAVLSGRGAY